MTTQGELFKIAAEHGYPRSWVNAFYLQTSTRAADASEPDDDEPTTDEGGGTPPA